jgi:hypothetical protein
VFHIGHRRGQRVARLVDFVRPGVVQPVVDIAVVVVASARHRAGLADMAQLLAVALIEQVLELIQCQDPSSTGACH